MDWTEKQKVRMLKQRDRDLDLQERQVAINEQVAATNERLSMWLEVKAKAALGDLERRVVQLESKGAPD